MATAGPLPSDIQPVANETRDRIITGLVTLIPFVALGFAAWQVWGEALHWSDVFLFVGMYLFTGLGITVGFHRHLTHRAFKAKPWLHGLLGDPRLGGDRGPGDLLGRRPPQAPRLLRRRGRPAQPARRPRARLERRHARPLPRPHGLALHPHPARQQGALRARPDQGPDHQLGRPHLPLWAIGGLLLPFVLGWAIGGTLFAGVTGLLWGGLVRVFVLHHFTYSINSLCHVFGNRDFETTDESRNLALIAIPTFGEAWHNNHHAFPTSAVHGLGRWQVDISALTIDGLEKLGLVWDVVRVSPERLAAKASDLLTALRLGSCGRFVPVDPAAAGLPQRHDPVRRVADRDELADEALPS